MTLARLVARLAVRSIGIVAAAWLCLGTPADAATFEIEPERTRVRFAVGHSDYTKPVKGRFERIHGRIEYDAEAPETLRIDVEIDADSIETRNRFRDEHLRAAFFETEEFPSIAFQLTRVLVEEEAIEGTLTMKGRSHPVRLHVSNVRDFVDPSGVRVLRCKANGTLNRRAFGVEEDPEGTAGLARILAEIQAGLDGFIDDEVAISISLSAREVHGEVSKDAPGPASNPKMAGAGLGTPHAIE